jgi:PAS domain S-box-containing protein
VDGSEIDIEAVGTSFTYHGEAAVQVFVRDITERKRAEQNQLRVKNLLEISQRLAHIGSWEYDLSTQTLSMSDEMYRIAGLPVGTPMDREIVESFFPSDELARSRHILSSLSSTDSLYRTDYKVKRKDGSSIAIHNEGEIVRDEHGKMRRIVGTTQDVTARTEAEEALKESEENFRSIVEQSTEGIVVTHGNGTVAEWNPAQEGTTGLKRSDVVGVPAWEVEAMIMPRDLRTSERIERIREKILGLLNGEDSLPPDERIEHPIVLPDGTMKFVSEHVFVIRKGLENRIVSIVSDVTEKKKAENDKLLADQFLQRAQKLESLGMLAGGIAHDFNNILTSIFGYMELARDQTKNENAANYLSQATNSIERAKALTQQLLTFSKGGAPVRKPTEMGILITETCGFTTSGSRTKCNLSIPSNLWNCNIDKNQIGQVVQNLVLNAVQAMPTGGSIEVAAQNVTLRESEHPSLSEGKYVLLSIEDHGIGISKEMLPLIFDPFFTTKTQGHGLGLSITHSIVLRHDGAINVQSELGKGTTFQVYLPASEQGSAGVSEHVSRKHFGTGRILVMDDEEGIRKLISEMLQSFGYSVVSTENGKDTINLFLQETANKRNYAAVILDLTIPGGIGGKEVAEAIREVDNETPLFVASGYAADEVVAHPEEYGFRASISKPFRKAELMEMLEKHLKKQD